MVFVLSWISLHRTNTIRNLSIHLSIYLSLYLSRYETIYEEVCEQSSPDSYGAPAAPALDSYGTPAAAPQGQHL